MEGGNSKLQHPNSREHPKTKPPKLKSETSNLKTLMKKHFANLTALTLVTLAVCGCSVLTYTGPNGERVMRGSFGANLAISSLAVEADNRGSLGLDPRLPSANPSG